MTSESPGPVASVSSPMTKVCDKSRYVKKYKKHSNQIFSNTLKGVMRDFEINPSSLKRKVEGKDDDCLKVTKFRKLDVSPSNIDSAYKEFVSEASKVLDQTLSVDPNRVLHLTKRHKVIGGVLQKSYSLGESERQKRSKSATVSQDPSKSISVATEGHLQEISAPDERPRPKKTAIDKLVPTSKKLGPSQASEESVSASKIVMVDGKQEKVAVSIPFREIAWAVRNIDEMRAFPSQCDDLTKNRKTLLSTKGSISKGEYGHMCTSGDHKSREKNETITGHPGFRQSLPPSPVLSLDGISTAQINTSGENESTSQGDDKLNMNSGMRNNSIPDLLSHINRSYPGNDCSSDIKIKNVRSIKDLSAGHNGISHTAKRSTFKLMPEAGEGSALDEVVIPCKATKRIETAVNKHPVCRLSKKEIMGKIGYVVPNSKLKSKPPARGAKRKMYKKTGMTEKLKIKFQPRTKHRTKAFSTMANFNKLASKPVSNVASSTSSPDKTSLKGFCLVEVGKQDAHDATGSDINVIDVWSESSLTEKILSPEVCIDEKVATHESMPQVDTIQSQEPEIKPGEQTAADNVVPTTSAPDIPESTLCNRSRIQQQQTLLASSVPIKPLVMLSDILPKLTPIQLQQLATPLDDAKKAACQSSQRSKSPLATSCPKLQQPNMPEKDSDSVASNESALMYSQPNRSSQANLSIQIGQPDFSTKGPEQNSSHGFALQLSQQNRSLQVQHPLQQPAALTKDSNKFLSVQSSLNNSLTPVKLSQFDTAAKCSEEAANCKPALRNGLLQPQLLVQSGEAETSAKNSSKSCSHKPDSPRHISVMVKLRQLGTPTKDFNKTDGLGSALLSSQQNRSPSVESPIQSEQPETLQNRPSQAKFPALQPGTPKKDKHKVATHESTFQLSLRSREPLIKLKRLPTSDLDSELPNGQAPRKTKRPLSEQESSIATRGIQPSVEECSSIAKTKSQRKAASKPQLGNNVEENVSSVRRRKYRHVKLKRLNDYYEIVITVKSMKQKKKDGKLSLEYNFLGIEALKELASLFLLCKKAENCKRVLLSSVGPIFCSGLDPLCLLNWNVQSEPSQNIISLTEQLIKILIDFEKPVIAVVQGPAVGFGASLLLFCDAIYASERGSIQWPAAHMGTSVCGCASYLLPKLTGLTKARSLLLGGYILTAKEAKTCGIITEVFPHDSYMRHGIAMCCQMCLASSVSVSHMKDLVVEGDRKKLHKCNSKEINVLKQCLGSQKCQECLELYIITKLITW